MDIVGAFDTTSSHHFLVFPDREIEMKISIKEWIAHDLQVAYRPTSGVIAAINL
jgi:hypothetical protein